jgi:hypothetical protein
VASFFERHADGELQKVRQIHSLRIAGSPEERSALPSISSLAASSDLPLVVISLLMVNESSLRKIVAFLTLKRPSEQSDHALCDAVHAICTEQVRKYDRKGVFLTGDDAELLSRALDEVKTKAYEQSEVSLDDTHALDALVSCFKSAKNDGLKEETRHACNGLLSKHLVLGTIIGKHDGAKRV